MNGTFLNSSSCSSEKTGKSDLDFFILSMFAVYLYTRLLLLVSNFAKCGAREKVKLPQIFAGESSWL